MSTSAPLTVSICVPAYNEAKNIEQILRALTAQKTSRITIESIIVVVSGSTDGTDTLAKEFAKINPLVKVIKQLRRGGKAAAINAFLRDTSASVVVIESADTIPNEDCIEKLCEPFLDNPEIGLTGGAPFPVNDPNTFTGYLVHTWWWFHRHIPRFGEIIAYRNILPGISATTAVDEAFIQAKIIQMGYKAVHINEAVVRNKGPETVSDLIRQRRRIFNGHSRLFAEEKVKIDNMTRSSLKLLLSFRPESLKHLFWLVGGIGIEIYARLLGAYDSNVRKVNPFIWDTATTTKELSLDLDTEEASNEANEGTPTT